MHIWYVQSAKTERKSKRKRTIFRIAVGEFRTRHPLWGCGGESGQDRLAVTRDDENQSPAPTRAKIGLSGLLQASSVRVSAFAHTISVMLALHTFSTKCWQDAYTLCLVPHAPMHPDSHAKSYYPLYKKHMFTSITPIFCLIGGFGETEMLSGALWRKMQSIICD